MFYVLCIISCPPNWLSKLALSAGSTAGRRGAGMRACGGWDAYHYMFVVQTNSGTGAKYYSFVVQTTIGL